MKGEKLRFHPIKNPHQIGEGFLFPYCTLIEHNRSAELLTRCGREYQQIGSIVHSISRQGTFRAIDIQLLQFTS